MSAKLAKAVQDLDRAINLDPKVVAEYRKVRREYTGIAASIALRWARGNLDGNNDLPEGFNVDGRKFTVDGFDIECGSEYDSDAETDWLGEWTNSDVDGALRNPNAWTSCGNAYGSEYRYFVPTYTEIGRFNDLHNAGMAKGPARKLAHEQAIKDMETARDMTQYVVWATAYRHGVELGHSGLGGVDESYIEGAIIDHDLIGEAISEAKAMLARLREGGV